MVSELVSRNEQYLQRVPTGVNSFSALGAVVQSKPQVLSRTQDRGLRAFHAVFIRSFCLQISRIWVNQEIESAFWNWNNPIAPPQILVGF
jgi:hypothetical protein